MGYTRNSTNQQKKDNFSRKTRMWASNSLRRKPHIKKNVVDGMLKHTGNQRKAMRTRSYYFTPSKYGGKVANISKVEDTKCRQVYGERENLTELYMVWPLDRGLRHCWSKTMYLSIPWPNSSAPACMSTEVLSQIQKATSTGMLTGVLFVSSLAWSLGEAALWSKWPLTGLALLTEYTSPKVRWARKLLGVKVCM